MTLAPIVLFVYNRPAHTRLTVEALQKNTLAKDSDLIIYSDAPKNAESEDAVRQVRQYIHQIAGFKSVTIIERETNLGMAHTIIDGVTSVVNKRGRIIVLEDDIVTSQFFLNFMNRALDYYENEPRVWHISGWNFPINPEGLPDAFFSRAMYCWGWATWADRWTHFQKAPDRLLAEWDAAKINRFNLDGKCDFWEQVKQNATGVLNTWGVFWYATIFEHNALCLIPAVTYVENIGLDQTGENCGETTMYSTPLNASCVVGLPDDVSESSLALARTQQFCTGAVAMRHLILPRAAAIIKKLLWWR